MMGDTNITHPAAATAVNRHGAKKKSQHKNKGKTKRKDEMRLDTAATDQVHQSSIVVFL